MDETSQKIIDAAMILVRDRGYVATTTKEIAKAAGVNECTLFRKFKNKKDIVLQGVSQAQWRAGVTQDIFKHSFFLFSFYPLISEYIPCVLASFVST